jgi:predicted RecB family nuclease
MNEAVPGSDRPQRRLTATAFYRYYPVEVQLRVRHADCEVIGLPDFLLRADGGYLIRDQKLGRRIGESAQVATPSVGGSLGPG